jgi:hypothetical protein
MNMQGSDTIHSAPAFGIPILELDLRHDDYNRLPNTHARNRVFSDPDTCAIR